MSVCDIWNKVEWVCITSVFTDKCIDTSFMIVCFSRLLLITCTRNKIISEMITNAKEISDIPPIRVARLIFSYFVQRNVYTKQILVSYYRALTRWDWKSCILAKVNSYFNFSCKLLCKLLIHGGHSFYTYCACVSIISRHI